MNICTIVCSLSMLVIAGCDSSPTTAQAQPTQVKAQPEPAPACTSTDGIAVVNGLLDELTPALNKAWPSVAVSTGLDPLKDAMVNQKVPLKCSEGGDEICGVQLFAKCKEQYAEVTVPTIRGLAYMQFKDLEMSSLDAHSGSQACPYGKSASGGTYACSYAGTGTGSAFLMNDEKLTADISKIKVKVKCEIPYVKTWTETVYSGSAKCTGSEPEGTGTFQLCGGSCASGPGANLSYTALSKLDLKLGKLSCDVSPWYNPVSWVGDVLAPKIKNDLVKAVAPEVQKAINGLVDDYMPFPSKCGG